MFYNFNTILTERGKTDKMHTLCLCQLPERRPQLRPDERRQEDTANQEEAGCPHGEHLARLQGGNLYIPKGPFTVSLRNFLYGLNSIGLKRDAENANLNI